MQLTRETKATILGLISPYLCYALYLKERKVAGKKFLIGLALGAMAMYGSMMFFALIASDEESQTVEDAETMQQIMAEPVMQQIIFKAVVTAFIVQQLWSWRLIKDIRRIARQQEVPQ